MFETIASTLPDAAAVTEQLVAHYGAEKLWQVEQLSVHFFRARLRDGSMAMVIVQPEGQVVIRELEEVG